jgi:hypothetical protein
MSYVVSNSEIETFQRCEMKFYFQHILGVMPEKLPDPLRTGLFGHKLFERYWELYMEGVPVEQIEVEVSNMLMDVIHDPVVGKILRNVLACARHLVEVKRLKPLKIEWRRIYPLMENLGFGMTPDLIAEFYDGPKKGNLCVLDWKFTGQYWNEQEIGMYQQIPKYVKFLNTFDYADRKIKYGLLVMLNTRSSAASNDLFRTKWIPLGKQKLARIALENYDLAVEVAQRKMLPMADQYNAARRTVNHYECKLCPFANDVCPMSLAGHDISKTLAVNYVENTYGYEGERANG